MRARHGVATALLSVPNRYMHSPNEMVSLVDLDHAATLIAGGGFGPRIAAAVARHMGCRRVLVPPAPGVLSASGLLDAMPRLPVAWREDGGTIGDGTATVAMKLPESLTEYRVMAVGASGADRFGGGTTSLRIKKPFMVVPSLLPSRDAPALRRAGHCDGSGAVLARADGGGT